MEVFGSSIEPCRCGFWFSLEKVMNEETVEGLGLCEGSKASVGAS